jgi:hypothetical protein
MGSPPIIYKTFTGFDKELHDKHMGSPPIIYKTFTGFDKELHDKHMGSPTLYNFIIILIYVFQI